MLFEWWNAKHIETLVLNTFLPLSKQNCVETFHCTFEKKTQWSRRPTKTRCIIKLIKHIKTCKSTITLYILPWNRKTWSTSYWNCICMTILPHNCVTSWRVHVYMYKYTCKWMYARCKQYYTRQSMFVKHVPPLWAYFIEATKL